MSTEVLGKRNRKKTAKGEEYAENMKERNSESVVTIEEDSDEKQDDGTISKNVYVYHRNQQ